MRKVVEELKITLDFTLLNDKREEVVVKIEAGNSIVALEQFGFLVKGMKDQYGFGEIQKEWSFQASSLDQIKERAKEEARGEVKQNAQGAAEGLTSYQGMDGLPYTNKYGDPVGWKCPVHGADYVRKSNKPWNTFYCGYKDQSGQWCNKGDGVKQKVNDG